MDQFLSLVGIGSELMHFFLNFFWEAKLHVRMIRKEYRHCGFKLIGFIIFMLISTYTLCTYLIDWGNRGGNRGKKYKNNKAKEYSQSKAQSWWRHYWVATEPLGQRRNYAVCVHAMQITRNCHGMLPRLHDATNVPPPKFIWFYSMESSQAQGGLGAD